jgi:hypothetical protein
MTTRREKCKVIVMIRFPFEIIPLSSAYSAHLRDLCV